MKNSPSIPSNVAAHCRVLALGALLASSTGGCLFLAVPTPPVHSGYARTNVTAETSAQFTPGRTSMTEVILQLGEPDSVSVDESQLAYRSEKVVGWWGVVAGGGYSAAGAGGVLYSERFYLFEFDPSGCFAKARVEYDGAMVPGLDRAELRPRPPLSSQAGGETVVRQYLHSLWFAGVDGCEIRITGSGRITNSATGQPGQLVLTESNLLFLPHAQFANAEPALKLPLSNIASVRMAKHLIGPTCVVVRTQAGENQSFEILGPYEILKDSQAMQEACDLVAARISNERTNP